MRKSLLSVVAILTIAVFLTSCSPTQTAANNQIQRMDVNGEGKVVLEPDIARVNIGVRSRSESITDALAQNTDSIQAIIDSLKEMGVDQSDIQTLNFNVYPQQEQRPVPQETEMEGPMQEMEQVQTYVVENTVGVIVRDLDSLGEILATVVANGANNINGVTFDVEDREAAVAEARQKAIEDAKAQAEAIAEAAGVKLGEIQSISIGGGNVPYAREMPAAEQAAGMSVPISEGTLTIQVTANISYAIK